MVELTSSEYIKKQQCIPFLEEFVFHNLILKNQTDSPEGSNSLLLLMTKDLSFIPQGLHIAFQEYDYINSSNENRLAFFNLFVTCFANICKDFTSMRIFDYFQFIRLLCPNFPETFIVFLFDNLSSDTKDTTHLDYLQFISTFKLCFLFKNYLLSIMKFFDIQSAENNKSRINLEELFDTNKLLQYCNDFKHFHSDHSLAIPISVLEDVVSNKISITYSQLVNMFKIHKYITEL